MSTVEISLKLSPWMICLLTHKSKDISFLLLGWQCCAPLILLNSKARIDFINWDWEDKIRNVVVCIGILHLRSAISINR